ncbi:hypothetical protein EDEG_03148 [Edhazardia aedis USNM 41457]|uniref:Uncharacterized protein n=1 Tax=Edhazardia aedis (strain USNM 41457) TaxID=1003232 RepID=J9D4G1_EDHAE|nr:hypothetical protein EDEG_03148 [Edhazardia aedis USNM 41457]|eukprot:EJW02444.1 hypothetical protein EDEG_03148 [Edhazardia aedis USNM 41457]
MIEIYEIFLNFIIIKNCYTIIKRFSFFICIHVLTDFFCYLYILNRLKDIEGKYLDYLMKFKSYFSYDAFHKANFMITAMNKYLYVFTFLEYYTVTFISTSKIILQILIP